MSAARRGEGPTGHHGPAETLVALAQLVVAGSDPERLAHQAVQATARALDADLCELLRTSSDGRLVRVASSDETLAPHEHDDVPGGVYSAAGYSLLCGTPVSSGHLGRERRFGDAGAPAMEGPVSAVAAPVPGRDGAYGALVAYAARADAFGTGHALSVARIASLLGGALRLLEEQAELRRRAESAERQDEPVGTRDDPPGREIPGLSSRQLEVLKLMAGGRSAKQIASELGVSIHTVRSHQRNLYRSLGIGSATGALKRAAELGLPGVLSPDSD